MSQVNWLCVSQLEQQVDDIHVVHPALSFQEQDEGDLSIEPLVAEKPAQLSRRQTVALILLSDLSSWGFLRACCGDSSDLIWLY